MSVFTMIKSCCFIEKECFVCDTNPKKRLFFPMDYYKFTANLFKCEIRSEKLQSPKPRVTFYMNVI